MSVRCPGCMKLKENSPVCEHCGFDEGTANASHQLPVGTVLREQYLVGKVLGQGGFGITYLGWDQYLDIPLAIKEYYPSGLVMRESSISLDVTSCESDAGTRFVSNKERFLREAKMLARFSHLPEIVQVKNFFLDHNTAYIAMEYVEGTTLKQHVKNSGGKLPARETLTLLKPVMEALGKVHQTGLIHRDISPDNIMLLPGGGVKVLDFGAGRDVGSAMVGQSLTSSTESILKPGYAPIEQYQKRGNLGPWTDVYALCGTIYYCLTGQVPPDAPERMLEYDDPSLFSDVEGLTKEEKQALERGTALRTEQRTASMEALCAELYTAQPKPVPAPEKPKPEPPPAPKPVEAPRTEGKKPKKKKRILPMLLALLLALAVGFGCAVTAQPQLLELLPPVLLGQKSGTCGENMSWTLDPGSGVLTLKGSGDMTDYLRPEETEDQNRLPPWHSHREKILTVNVTEQVTSIGDNAFSGCENLWKVTFNDHISEIGAGAFRGTDVRSVKIPNQVTMVGAGAFAQCERLSDLTLYQDTAISYDTWKEPLITDSQGNLSRTVTIRGNTNSLAESYAELLGYRFDSIATGSWDAEGKCGNSLNWYLDFETGLLKIQGQGAMYDYNGIWQDQKWENGYRGDRTLAPWADHADKIRLISIGDGITVIGENAFVRCSNLKDVHFGNTLKTISTYAFHTCGIDELVLPDSVTEIEEAAFTWCLDLSYVRLPLELKQLRENTFNNCQFLKELYVGADTSFDDGEMTPFGQLTSGSIPGEIVIYSLPGSKAEAFCADYLFPDFAPGYDGLQIEEMGQCGNELFWFLSGDTLVLYGNGSSWLYRITQQERQDWAERDWPKEYLQEGDPDFYPYRARIRNIRILPGVDGLNHRLFTDMPNLKSIDFGTVQETHMCINNCGLEYVCLPESLEFVGEYMFAGCEKLRIVEILGGSGGFGEGVFDGCVNLEQLWLEKHAAIGDQNIFNPQPGSAISDKLVLFVKRASAAEWYALENGLNYGYH